MASIVDLTKPLASGMEIYKENDYADPSFNVTPWCDIADQGYCVAKMELGTQTGTHIDAPRHFISEGDTLDKLSAQALAGSYLVIDVDNGSALPAADTNESFLFLRFKEDSFLTENEFEGLFKHSAPIWVITGIPRVKSWPLLEFHRAVARAGKYLVENLADEIAENVKPGGLMIVAPLPLEDVSGSPCRVMVLFD